MARVISCFDVCLVQLDPTLGHEIQKMRPCVVISPDEINHANWTFIVAPMSSQIKKLPTRLPIEFEDTRGQILLDQIRSIDAQRVVKRLGKIDPKTGHQVLLRLQEMFSI